MLLDLTDLNDDGQNATISVQDGGRIVANGTFAPGFGSGWYQSYTCVDFQGGSIFDTGIYVNIIFSIFKPAALFVSTYPRMAPSALESV